MDYAPVGKWRNAMPGKPLDGEADDPEDSKELAAGVDKVVAAGSWTPYEIRWELIGWWHDDE